MKNNNEKYFYEFGYKTLGPFLMEYTIWLLKQLKDKHINKVYFIAREGYVLKQAFDLLNNTEIKTYYLKGSRRSIIIPQLWRLDNVTDIFNVITMSRKIKIIELIKKIGLEDYELQSELESYGLNYEEYIDTERIPKEVILFLNHIFPIIKENSKKEWFSLKKYLNKMNFKGKLAIVDIGWHGTMQNSLSYLMMENADIYGFYLGCESKYHSDREIGFLFNNKTENNYFQLKKCLTLMEFFFLAQEGSVKRFIEDGSVELYEYEYLNMYEAIIARCIQKGAYDYIDNNRNSVDKTKSNSVHELFNVMLHPNLKQAKLFGNLTFVDKNRKFIAKPDKLISYIMKPKKVLEDYVKSGWRIGFLKRLFKISFDYNILNEFIRYNFLKDKIGIDNKRILKKIYKADIVSFDIYDTLIYRKTDTLCEKYELVQNRYNSLFGSNIMDFVEQRILAEKKARNMSDKCEIDIQNIYDELNYSKKEKSALMKCEKEVEVEIAYYNKSVKEILDYCNENHKRVIITSDMYLDEKTIQTILKDNKIDYGELYLSSKYNLTKAKGNIFDYIIKNENIKPKKMLHIGDNKKSDYVVPILKGIRCIRIK